MEGLAMGGSVGGLYGAGGGLVLGFLTGLFTADSYYGQLNSQIQTEQSKDRQLEAAIEQELERQRALETQVAKASAPATNPSQSKPITQEARTPSPRSQNSPTPARKPETDAIAAVTKNPPSTTPVSPFKNVELRDINGDGVPDIWIYYDPLKPGEIVRQEEATQGDGRVNTWSHFRGGKLVRREVDRNGSGRADNIFYYENDKIALEERDDGATGQMNYRAFYQHGRLVRVEKITTQSGKPDVWIYYDLTQNGEVVLREERDLNGDGAVDLWSHYQQGRLVRRDVSAVGLELLSKQNEAPLGSIDAKQISASGG